MEDEGRRILEMVEQGRISAQEANELLAALQEPDEGPPLRLGEHHRRTGCGKGDRGCVGDTVGEAADAVVRALFTGPERRRLRWQR